MARYSAEVTKFNYPLLLSVNDARYYLELSETESASHQSQALLYLSEQRALDIVLANVFISMGRFGIHNRGEAKQIKMEKTSIMKSLRE